MPCSSANFLLEKTEQVVHCELSDCCLPPQGENVDVKALRARFNNHGATLDSSSRDSGSPKSPRPALALVTDSDLANHRLSPTIPSLMMASPGPGPGPGRLPRPDPPAPSITARANSLQWTPPHLGAKPSTHSPNSSKVKQMGDLLQNKCKLPSPNMAPGRLQPSVRAPNSFAPLPLRRQHQQRPSGDVTPLRRPLPPEGPVPLKPKRPPRVNLEPFLRHKQKPSSREPAKTDGESHIQLKKNNRFKTMWDFSF